jgi:hypothetical protein
MANNGKTHAALADLNLTTATDAPPRHVSIDGELFEMANPDALDLRAFGRTFDAATRLDALTRAGKGEISDDALDTFRTSSVDVLAVILPKAPRALLAKLPDVQRLYLLRFFVSASTTMGMAAARHQKTPNRKSKSRRGSRASTAAA